MTRFRATKAKIMYISFINHYSKDTFNKVKQLGWMIVYCCLRINNKLFKYETINHNVK